jgi:hypothetical protein
MDTSKTYIQMCDKAKEIQEEWIPHGWDYCYCVQGKQVVVLSGYETDGGYYGHGVDTDPWEENKPNEIICSGSSNIHIYLPRQDQLQKMIKRGDAVFFPYSLLWRLYRAISPDSKNNIYNPNFTSMEQLWLAFVMKEKYNEVWNGEEWIKA